MSEPATHQLTPDTRTKYVKALNDLVGTLSLTKSTPVDVTEFCQRHGLRASFFDALRDLDALVYDFAKSGIDEHYYRCTSKLIQISPEQLVSQMKASGRSNVKTKREEGEQDSKRPITGHSPQQEAAAVAGLKQAATELEKLPAQTTLTQVLDKIVQEVEEVVSEPKRACVAGDCGMGYCDEHGCIDQKQTADVLPLAPVLPVEPATTEQGVWKGTAEYQEKTTISLPPEPQPGDYLVQAANGDRYANDTYERCVEVAKEVSKEQSGKVKIFKCIAEVECIHSFKITPIA